MSIIRKYLRRSAHESGAAGVPSQASHRTQGRVAATAAGIGAIALAAAATWYFAPDDWLNGAFAPRGVFADLSQDDGAGDASDRKSVV